MALLEKILLCSTLAQQPFLPLENKGTQVSSTAHSDCPSLVTVDLATNLTTSASYDEKEVGFGESFVMVHPFQPQ